MSVQSNPEEARAVAGAEEQIPASWETEWRKKQGTI
jgi:hypothetical protein